MKFTRVVVVGAGLRFKCYIATTQPMKIDIRPKLMLRWLTPWLRLQSIDQLWL